MTNTPKDVQELVNKAVKKLPKDSDPILKGLLSVIGSQIAPDDLEFFDADLLAETTENLYSMAKGREYGEARVQIYCPVGKTGSARKTYINIIGDNFAFFIDSVVAEINKNKLLIDMLHNPNVYLELDAKGNRKAYHAEPKGEAKNKAFLHIQIKETLNDKMLADLEAGLNRALEDVYFTNRDWENMLAKLKQARDDLGEAHTKRSMKEIEKYCAFLDYLHDNNFTLLGSREYEFVEQGGDLKSKTVKGSGLGLLADDVSPAYISETDEGLPRNLQELRRKLEPVSISKTNRLSTVHRRVPMDAIAVKTYHEDGSVKGERLFLGLFTSVTYSRSVSSVPYLREKVDEVIDMSGYIDGSHDRKALRHILEKYPRDELFQITTDELLKISQSILRLQERQRISLFMRQDPFKRYISCLIYVPRERFGTDLRKSMVSVLEQELNGTCTNLFTNMDDSVFARIMVVINVSQKDPPKYDPDAIEQKLLELGKTWPEKLSEALANAYKEDEDCAQKTKHLLFKYSQAFPISYTSRYDARGAIYDIEKTEKVIETGQIQIDLYRPSGMEDGQLRLKLYHKGAPVILSDILPILDNMGFVSIAELPFEISPNGGKTKLWIHDFQLSTPDLEEAVVIEDIKVNFEKAFVKIWNNDVESDDLNYLLVSARANWHEINILRAYVKYLRQLRFPFSTSYMDKAICNHPKISRHLIDLFKAYHNPANGDKSQEMADALIKDINALLQKVESIDEDRILRALFELVQATMRTNYYVREEDGSGKGYLSLKISSRKVKDIPEPKPFMEIFVYSTRVEAVHLRGDKIARGGLRWSDRHEDFRTEVLGLMKAQMVKNAVIVPMGAKGGFVVKTEIKNRDEFRKEGIECYKIFIRGLLDITDNRVGKKIVPPKDVVCRDEEDPYLVVAADKGTATFSDIANGLSQEYGFWLDDAFASGGSAGYDHKVMGITARGAWESVKAHFREMGINTQKEEFDVIGVGDMGGDVFGNGMLLSEHIRLIGAFNHLHIFCDPYPDAAKTYKERKRLFDEVKGWDDYNESLLSKGGRIFSRSEKLLTLTSDIQKAFDIDKKQVTPDELISAMLRAKTDLLWFGGIGTYIKSSEESNEDVGDKANDYIRVNGKEVRAKVIGEGANLGTTQLGRIEFAENGGCINTDFIDNSGGVDSSDHEVNIKILLTEIMKDKSTNMDLKSRNALLEKMTDDVGELVLRSNYQQAQALSLIERRAVEDLQLHKSVIHDMERDGILKPSLEYLPDMEEFEERSRKGQGLTRPELAVLLSYAKIEFTSQLLESDIPDNPDMLEWILGYFPEILQSKYKDEILKHRLRREIIATTMSNSLINRMGPSFTRTISNTTGACPAETAKAYIIVRDAFGLRKLWDGIEQLDNKVPADVQLRAMQDIASLSEHTIRWLLTRMGRTLDISEDIKTFGNGIAELKKNLSKVITPELKALTEDRAEEAAKGGLPKELAKEIALLPVLASAFDIIRISLEAKTDLVNTAVTYFELGERFQLDWLRNRAKSIDSKDYWMNEALSALLDQFFDIQADMSVRILKDTANSKEKSSALELWLSKKEYHMAQLDVFLEELIHSERADLPMLVLAEQRLRTLYEG